jgi:hypothetical protein
MSLKDLKSLDLLIHGAREISRERQDEREFYQNQGRDIERVCRFFAFRTTDIGLLEEF